MKRFLFVATAVCALLAASCQKSDDSEPLKQEQSDVQITVNLPGEMDETRAYGDGETVDRCIMAVYLDGEPYGERQTAAVSGLQATFSVRLVSGRSYDLVFWADKTGADQGDLHYDTSAFPEVRFTGDYAGNDETRDAFFGTAVVEADQSKAVTVELKRPFGQLNIATLDMADVPADLQPTQVSIAFDAVPTGVNLLTGELVEGAAGAVAYVAPVALIDQSGTLTCDYILAPKTEGEQYLANFTMSFLDDEGAEVASDYTFSSIPVQRNYRTNVSGYLLTKKADVTVEVKPGFDATILSDGTTHQVPKLVSNLIELNGVLTNTGGYAQLASDITVVSSMMVMSFKDIDLDLNGHTLTFANEDGTTSVYSIYSNTTIRNGKIVAKTNSETDAPLLCGSGYSLTLDGVEFESSASCVGTASGGDNATIAIKNSTLKCKAYAVSTIAAKPAGANINISIEGSTLEADVPVLFNIPSTLTIDDCTINAFAQGLILRGGTATVSNSTITLDTTNSFTDQADAKSFASAFDTADWGTGNKVNVAAITAGNKGGNSYQYPTVLTLENTQVKSVGTYASLFPALYVWANQGEGLGVTINYDAQSSFTGGTVYGSANIVVNGVPRE